MSGGEVICIEFPGTANWVAAETVIDKQSHHSLQAKTNKQTKCYDMQMHVLQGGSNTER